MNESKGNAIEVKKNGLIDAETGEAAYARRIMQRPAKINFWSLSILNTYLFKRQKFLFVISIML